MATALYLCVSATQKNYFRGENPFVGNRIPATRQHYSCFLVFWRWLAHVPFKRPAPTCNENDLYEYAIGALSRKMRTVAEVKRLLRQRCPDEAVVSSVIIRLKGHRYLNDSSYAAAYAALRRDNQKFGSKRVITDLKVKGVHSEVIEKAVSGAYSEVDELAHARAFLKRKRLNRPTNNREAARIFRALMRAGFGVSTSIRILKNWEVEDEVLTALQEESSQ